MKIVTAVELRRNLKACVDQVEQTGEPIALMLHGHKRASIVPFEGADILEQITEFDKCDIAPDALKEELHKLLHLALMEVSASPEPSLMKIIKKLATDATTIQQYRRVCKLLKISET